MLTPPPFRGPLALVKPYVRTIARALVQSRKYEEFSSKMSELYRNLRAISQLVISTNARLDSVLNSAPDHSLAPSYELKLLDWQRRLRPIRSEANDFLRDYQSIQGNLIQLRASIDLMKAELDTRKKKSLFQNTLEILRTSEYELLALDFLQSLRDLDRAVKRLKETANLCKGMLPED